MLILLAKFQYSTSIDSECIIFEEDFFYIKIVLNPFQFI